jgi:16S rRNA (cytidine1402-2'-O)-methyltransferase
MGRHDQDDRSQSPAAARVVPRVEAEAARLLATPLAPGLRLVATPIGHLGDITLRALAVLARADLVYCEDTRHSRTLLAHYGIGTPTRPYHDHNAEAERPRVLAALAAGRRVALISDAGTPLVSDPGFKLVRACLAEGHRVESVPGPSAVLAALSSSGLPTDAFLFAGFLPPRSAARRARIAELAAAPATLVLFEAPSRVAATLADLAARLGPERPAALARELTKLHEEVGRGTLGELAATAAETAPRGEIVLLVGPPQRVEAADEAIRERLAAALAELSLRDAAQAVAEAMGVPRSRVYDLGLRLRRERE